jgi:enolase
MKSIIGNPEWIAKYNQLLRIEEELGSMIRYTGGHNSCWVKL